MLRRKIRQTGCIRIVENTKEIRTRYLIMPLSFTSKVISAWKSRVAFFAVLDSLVILHNLYCSGEAEEAHFLTANSLRSSKGARAVRYWVKSAESAKGRECYGVSHRLHFLIRTLCPVAK